MCNLNYFLICESQLFWIEDTRDSVPALITWYRTLKNSVKSNEGVNAMLLVCTVKDEGR